MSFARRIPTGVLLLLSVLLIAANVSVYRAVFAPAHLAVTVLEAGKGSAALVRSPSGTTILIDTGPDAGILRELGSVLPLWQRRLDAVILTSAVTASAGGLPEILRRYHVSALVRPASEGPRSLEAAIKEAAGMTPVIIATRGDRLSAHDGLAIDILWPPDTAARFKTANGALALRISYSSTLFLIQNVPARIKQWLSADDDSLTPPDLIISSTTPKGVYVSDGVSVRFVTK